MIVRSGLIRNRDGVGLLQFGRHWKDVHGPLALHVAGMRAYVQNHVVQRLPADESARLHRVDGLSQLWFDDVDAMTAAMRSPEQQACIDDIRGFLAEVTILVQQEGEMVGIGETGADPAKLIYLLRGGGPAIANGIQVFTDWFARRPAGARLRLNPVIARDFTVDGAGADAEQVADAVLEVWPGDASVASALAEAELPRAAGLATVGAFVVEQVVLRAR